MFKQALNLALTIGVLIASVPVIIFWYTVGLVCKAKDHMGRGYVR